MSNRNDSRYNSDNSKKGTRRPTPKEIAGIGAISGRDTTGNDRYPLSPPRPSLPGRGDPKDSLDRFSPPEYRDDDTPDFMLDDDSDFATPEEITDPTVEMNTQGCVTDECPSIIDPNRFVQQNRGGYRSS